MESRSARFMIGYYVASVLFPMVAILAFVKTGLAPNYANGFIFAYFIAAGDAALAAFALIDKFWHRFIRNAIGMTIVLAVLYVLLTVAGINAV